LIESGVTLLPFRSFHLVQILRLFTESTLPIDLFLKRYFASHKAIGAHDRRYITERVYKAIRWQGLLSFLSKNSSWEEKLPLLEQLDPTSWLSVETIPLHDRWSFPESYVTFLQEQLGEEKAKKFCLISNHQAPTTIRTNALKTTREALFIKLKQHHDVVLGEHCPFAISFKERVNFLTLSEFREGLFEVQDEGSQLLSLYVPVKPGDQFLDFCAGSGGKTLAIAPKMQGRGQIYLYDIRHKALLEAKKRLYRAGIQNAQIVQKDSLPSLLGKMDVVLVDAPCSGSGTLRRNPDMKWKFSLSSLQATIELQRTIFAEALSFVKPGGWIIYATCSIFPKENEEQLHYFLQNYQVRSGPPPFSSFPSAQGMDGFYAVALQKS